MKGQQLPPTLRALLADLDAQGIHDARRYAAVRKYLCFKAREKNRPISGSFELTPLCNLDCKMCYVHLQKEQMQGKPLLNPEQWKAIMTQAIDSGMMFASLTGGECLTYPGFKDLYLFLRSKGVEVNILTNGVLMDEAMAAFLQQAPPALVQITLYGASDDAYERVTGSRSFGRVWQNILHLKQLGIPLQIAVTPNAFMQDGEAVVRLLHESGLSFSINAGLLQPRSDTGRALMDADTDSYIAMMRLNMALRGHPPEPDLLAEDFPEPNTRIDGIGKVCGVSCGGGRSAFSVDWQGGLRPCNNFPCEAENVLTLGFPEAWRRVNHTACTYPRPAECEGCAYRELCKHCVAEHAAGAPSGHASPAICAWCKQMVAAGLLKLQRPEQ